MLDVKIPLKLRIKVYKIIIRPVLLYGMETWSLRQKEESLHERMEMREARYRIHISRVGKRSHGGITRMCGTCGIVMRAREARVRYFTRIKRN